VWITNSLGNSVTKLRASDGTLLGTFTAEGAPVGIAFDGANIWVANSAALSSSVTKLRASDGALLGTFPVGGQAPWGIVFDGTSIWVSNSESNSVSKITLGGLAATLPRVPSLSAH
jgi:DNA-binding beta-propeller fold protein YncE